MAVLNVTPDSFSDGGRTFDPEAAVAHGLKLIAEGADLVDVGGESTRPGAEPVAAAEERRRILPVVRALAPKITISIDTTKAPVAAAAVEAGASIVNDVSAGTMDPEMLPLVARAGAAVILMHRQGMPKTMQRRPRYRDVVGEVRAYLEARVRAALEAGVAPGTIAVDPGIGFGKTLEHNLELLRRTGEIAALGCPMVIGVSRKSFLGKIQGAPEASRLEASIAAALVAVERGARVVRVHDVAATVRALRVAEAIWALGRG